MHEKTEQQRPEKRKRRERGMSEEWERERERGGVTITGKMGGRRIGLRERGGGVMYSVLSAPPTHTHPHTHNSVFTYHPWAYSPSSTILWHFPIELHWDSIRKPQCWGSSAQEEPRDLSLSESLVTESHRTRARPVLDQCKTSARARPVLEPDQC